MDFGTTVLGAMGIILGVLMPVIVVGLILWYKARRNQLMHETAVKLAEQGQPVPSSLFADQTSPFASLRTGVVLLMLGLGICLAFFLGGIKFWAVGIIPMFMGLGYLIVWKLEGGSASAVVER
ncbi:MAG: DUF6249 domain-containing protein [Betaproteobacteria bacterium]